MSTPERALDPATLEITEPAARPLARSWLVPLAWCAILAIGAGLRVVLFSGYGLGDDPNYFSAYYGAYQTNSWSQHVPYHFRFSFWVPVVALMKLGGVTEWTWVGFVTLCSILNLPLVYALARQEWEREWALLAMALLAVFPLDVMTSTLFAVDIPMSTYCYTAFWLYRVAIGRHAHAVVRFAAAVLSGAFLFLGYSAKQWALLIGVLFAIEALRRLRQAWVMTVVCGATFAGLVAAYFTWQWRTFGDPLYDVHLVSSVAWFEPHTWANQLDYYKMLLLPNPYGGFFAGWYPHALALLAVAFALRVRTAGKWLLYFLIEMVCLSSMPGRYDKGQWLILVTHIFRYLCFISIPLSLALAGYLRELVGWRRTPGLVFTALLLGCAVVQSFQVSWPTRDAFGEQRRANALIMSMFPDEILWSDFGFLGRLMSFAPDRRGITRMREIRPEEPVAQARELAKVTDGVVVTGGGRLPWYGCITCAVSMSSFTPPPTWTLVTMYGEAELGPNRREPLRIWRVGGVVPRVNQLFSERVDQGGRFALLQQLSLAGDDAVAAEVGRRLLEQRMEPSGTIAYLTGLSYSRIDKAATARLYWARALDREVSPGDARRIVLTTIASGSFEDRDVLPEWIARFRARFPLERLDPVMEEVLPGFPEVELLLRTQRYWEAAAKLRAIRDRADETPERRQRAHYFAALALFRHGAVDEGAQDAETYRARYADDPRWPELRYREGEARLIHDRARARAVFADVAAQAPRSFWAGEARRRMMTIDPPAVAQ